MISSWFSGFHIMIKLLVYISRHVSFSELRFFERSINEYTKLIYNCSYKFITFTNMLKSVCTWDRKWYTTVSDLARFVRPVPGPLLRLDLQLSNKKVVMSCQSSTHCHGNEQRVLSRAILDLKCMSISGFVVWMVSCDWLGSQCTFYTTYHHWKVKTLYST